MFLDTQTGPFYTMGTDMTALLIALVSAIVSAGATWLLGSQDRAQAKKSSEAHQAAADAQKKIAELESERARREFFLQFAPKTHFHFGLPQAGNVLRLEAAEPFTVDSIHYLTGSNARLARKQSVRRGLRYNSHKRRLH
jgi:type II secretory pathway pseudopilin PulG